MNTIKSKKFTNKKVAMSTAKRRGKEIYLLGKNSSGNKVWFVGDYKDALKVSRKFK